jgi:hypothetical protein
MRCATSRRTRSARITELREELFNLRFRNLDEAARQPLKIREGRARSRDADGAGEKSGEKKA